MLNLCRYNARVVTWESTNNARAVTPDDANNARVVTSEDVNNAKGVTLGTPCFPQVFPQKYGIFPQKFYIFHKFSAAWKSYFEFRVNKS